MMENLTISDAPPGAPASQPFAQLPPQMFTTAAQLLDLTDKYPYGYFADITHGIFLVRGENVLLLGEIDLDKDDDAPPGYELAEVEVVKKLAEAKKTADKAKEKARLKKLVRIGFEGENLGDIFF
ncbi:uncharacterized protein Triagg1_9607 [Trichoderma aggressivum f. europaeum]|uniref:LSM domain-containing protein n=1 Tax=Trichoderma aggressivum f. europaeum TaxID=173218 RepID=A0AAE1I6N2_9HYPO|nr:hypothetical protein Triagg1_9607 [Trichoderma aggressivum f. europaeum]